MSLASGAVKLPLRHLSIRVPWHDAGWDGTICRHPLGNGSCLILENISKNRDDAWEEANAGKAWDSLQGTLPPCVGERAGFMAPFATTRRVTHPYMDGSSPAHRVFQATPFTYPAYSAPAVPFQWMLRESAEGLAERHGIGIDWVLEDQAHDAIGFKTAFVQHGRNQRAMLDSFFSAVEPKRSLCFFYAKQAPIADASGRILIGAGMVTSVDPDVEYLYTTPQPPLRQMLWERSVHHSIRPKFVQGFLLPYHQLLDAANSNPDMDLSPYVAHVPSDHWWEFSYGSEHVTHDAAIAALLVCAEKLREAAKVLPGDFDAALQWIDARLSEVWKLRGPYPGLGAALTAFGLPHGNFLAYDLATVLHENEDPWPAVEAAFDDPSALRPEARQYLGPTIRDVWKSLPEERRALLKLLARFEITADQATRFYREGEREKARITVGDGQLLANPYLLYELDRFSPDAISMPTIDRGVFPDAVVRLQHSLPEPTRVDEPIDRRRVRAGAVTVLETAAANGDTLLPRNRLLDAICELPLSPACPATTDMLPIVEPHFAGEIDGVAMADGSPAYQLVRLTDAGKAIRGTVMARTGSSAQRHTVNADWPAVLAEQLIKSGVTVQTDADESRAREEKAAALAELAAARLAVLIGPAGTGKTTLLAALINQPQIKAGGVILLTPTGKARVQLQQRAGLPAQTIAQFLIKLHRYDGSTGNYLLQGDDPIHAGKTLIIDEASMLTEEQLAATLKAVKGVERLILVGDPRQLPPIGSGRPFVDIVTAVRPATVEGQFPRVGHGYAELTVVRRHGGANRDDLLLASWFSGSDPDPGADEVWSRVAQGIESKWLRFIPWQTPAELHDHLLDALVRELNLAGRTDEQGFEKSLGGSTYGDAVFFWSGRNGQAGAAEKAEDWQILTPVRGEAHGVTELNRMIQRTFRTKARQWANSDARRRRTPPPAGPEEIVYGDKVISTTNERRRHVYPEAGALKYVANGEIGIVVGQFKTKNFHGAPKHPQVEFSSQIGYSYDYYAGDLSENGALKLELAYALTIHRAQGSEFGLTFLILPEHARTLSRELLYTALTRQRGRVVILHQGDLAKLKQYDSPFHSETARRHTSPRHGLHIAAVMVAKKKPFWRGWSTSVPSGRRQCSARPRRY
ncbi:MAG: AAA family ATPase [Solirubrobacteraceae bacterium]